MDQGLSIVIPALNEEENVPKLLEDLGHYFESYEYEIILIDDFSDKNKEVRYYFTPKSYNFKKHF